MKPLSKKMLISVLLMLLAGMAAAQNSVYMVSGVVRDDNTGKRLNAATITNPDSHEATVTNEDGFFTLKTKQKPSVLLVSCLGYNTVTAVLPDDLDRPLRIRLKPGVITLNEIIVSTMDPEEIVMSAIDKIHHNYSHDNELLRCFYRETTQKGKRYIFVAEAVTHLYKAGYNRLTGIDRVAIEKGRRLVSTRANDTLGAKIQGGPTLPIGLDLMKKRDILLERSELAHYHLRIGIPEVIDGRPQIVISFEPAEITDHVLYHGRMLIDRETLSFTRIEMSLDMSDEIRATECILRHKPAGVRFKPRELTTTIDYRYDGHVSRLHYLHSDVRFYCEWRKRLFAAPYHVTAEMVVTDVLSTDAQPISGRSSFGYGDYFYDKVQAFNDPDFWRDYIIIEPTESLEHAIGKLSKKRKEKD